MPVIADTAYPRLPAELGPTELEAFTPEAAELAFARQRTRRPGPRLALLVLRNQPAMGPLLIVHLGTVLALFVTLPYGKFVHGVYRIAALLIDAREGDSQ